MTKQICSYFNNTEGCSNISELLEGTKYSLDFCAMHNHMYKLGMPTKCWRCGDKEDIKDTEIRRVY